MLQFHLFSILYLFFNIHSFQELASHFSFILFRQDLLVTAFKHTHFTILSCVLLLQQIIASQQGPPCKEHKDALNIKKHPRQSLEERRLDWKLQEHKDTVNIKIPFRKSPTEPQQDWELSASILIVSTLILQIICSWQFYCQHHKDTPFIRILSKPFLAPMQPSCANHKDTLTIRLHHRQSLNSEHLLCSDHKYTQTIRIHFSESTRTPRLRPKPGLLDRKIGSCSLRCSSAGVFHFSIDDHLFHFFLYEIYPWRYPM